MDFIHLKKLKSGELAEISAVAKFIFNCDCCYPNSKAHLDDIKIKEILIFKNENELHDGEGRIPSEQELDELNSADLSSELDSKAYSQLDVA